MTDGPLREDFLTNRERELSDTPFSAWAEREHMPVLLAEHDVGAASDDTEKE